MTEERRKLARELLAKATPRPWVHVSSPGFDGDVWEGVHDDDEMSVAFSPDNCRLIAAAPEMLAEALDEIDRLSRIVDRVLR
jgi:hypothetical protein